MNRLQYVPVFCLGVIVGIELKKTFTERLPLIAGVQAKVKAWLYDGIGEWHALSDGDADE